MSDYDKERIEYYKSISSQAAKGNWPDDNRIDAIGQNGNNAEIYHFNHKHGHASPSGVSPTYSTWRSMKDRCYNTESAKYYRYGGRGILVCDDWKEEFTHFLRDMGEKPEGRTLDRINNDKGYSPDNCRWASPKEQARNTSRNVFIKYDGEVKCISEWLEISGLPRTTFYRRYYAENKRGDALFMPTVHMRREVMFEEMQKIYEETGTLNFTSLAESTGESRKTLAKVWKEFTEEAL